MVTVVSHSRIRRLVEEHRPNAMFFQGPDSVGKWTTAEWFREALSPVEGDILRTRYLSVDRARAVVSFLQTSPYGESRLAIVGIDDSTNAAQEVMLKAVEEISPAHWIIFVGEQDLIPPLLSRVLRYRFSYLSVSDIEAVLALKGFGEAKAARLAHAANGQVQNALDHHETQEKKIVVQAAVRSILEHDPKTLGQLVSRWSEDHTDLLAMMCREIITARWGAWTETEAEGVPKATALKILRSLRMNVRPRLIVQASLMSVLMGEAA